MERMSSHPLAALLMPALAIVIPAGAETAAPALLPPGAIWQDNNGRHINAHGGGILYHDGRYYWFGEHKTEGEGGNRANVGVHCYSSKNLYDWRDEGIALAVDPEGREAPSRRDVFWSARRLYITSRPASSSCGSTSSSRIAAMPPP